MVKKILVVLVIAIIAISMFTSIHFESNAATMPINKADLYSKGEVVFFSPASASFDMFKNFADRGNKFKKLVNEI